MSFHFVKDQVFHDPRGWKMRNERAKAKIAHQRDPHVQAVRRVRYLFNAPAEAEARVREEWAAAQQLVPSPIPVKLHPHALALLIAFLDREGLTPDDLTQPMREERDALEHAVTEAIEAAREDQRQAQADLDRLIAQRAAYEAMVSQDYTQIDVGDVPARAGVGTVTEGEDSPAAPERVVAQVANALDRAPHVDVEVYTDESEPVLPVRRGPGRPSKVSS